MIVSSLNNTYNTFLKQSGTYSVPTASTSEEKKEIASVKVGEVKSENSKPDSKKVFGIIGISLGSAVLLTLIGLFSLSKGFSVGLAKKFSLISEKIKNTITELSSQTHSLTLGQKFKLKMTKAVQPIAEFMEASSNITAIKDSLTNKIIKKMKLESVVKKINTFFKDKIVLKTKNNAYKKAELSIVELSNYLEKIAKQSKNPELSQKAKELFKSYIEQFSLKAHVLRSEKNWESMDGLSDIVYGNLFKENGRLVKNFKQLKSYVTTDLTANEREILKKELTLGQQTVETKIKEALEMLSPEQKKLMQKYANKAGKNLENAIQCELAAFNKLAEIQVGSVTTDILGIIAPSAIATGLIINSNNKNERIGTTLTKGIPVLGGLGVSYYGSTRGFTGGKNLALGLITAYILNIFGTKANDAYKKYIEKQNILKKAFESLNKLQNKEV